MYILNFFIKIIFHPNLYIRNLGNYKGNIWHAIKNKFLISDLIIIESIVMKYYYYLKFKNICNKFIEKEKYSVKKYLKIKDINMIYNL